jgi:hypothetical protein
MKYFTTGRLLFVAVITMIPVSAALPRNEDVTADDLSVVEKYMHEGKWDIVYGVLSERGSDFKDWSLYIILMAAAHAGAISVVSLLVSNQQIFMRMHCTLQEKLHDHRTLMGMVLEAAVVDGCTAAVDIILMADETYKESYRCDLVSINKARCKARELGYQALEQKLGQKFAEVTKDWLWE